MSNYFSRFKMASCPFELKRDGYLIPNLIGTYLCGKETCYRMFDCREMGVEVLEVSKHERFVREDLFILRGPRTLNKLYTC